MTETRHTPGPWGYVYDGSSTWSVGPYDDPQVGSVLTVYDRKDDRARANARLIAAAPDMLTALRAIKASCPTDPDVSADFNAAWGLLEAAIARAETDQ